MNAARSAFHDHCAVLARMLAGDSDGVRDRLAAGATTAREFLIFMERHYLTWYLLGAVDAAGCRDVFPADELRRVECNCATRQARQGLLLDELARLCPTFRERGVDLIVLKGPYLAERFFGGARQRAFVDLDLLIRREQLRAAEALLAASGYDLLSTPLVSRGLTTRFTHGFDFASAGRRLDLHWCLGAHASYRIDYDRVWRDRAPFRVERTEMAVLSDADALFFHLLSLFEDLDRGSARLRSFVDIYAMLAVLDSGIDWTAFWEQRQRERTARPCQAVLGLFFVLFDAEARFPRIASTLAAMIELVRAQPRADIAALIEARAGAFANKAWAAQFYECPRSLTAAWWCVSLPFRLAVYEPGRWSRFTARIYHRASRVRRRSAA